MPGVGYGFGFGPAAVGPRVGGSATVIANAVALRMPGDDSAGTTPETARPTSTGTPVVSSPVLTNLSSAPITELAAIFIGWVHSATGSTNVGNDVPLTATVTNVDNTVTFGTLTVLASSSFTIANGATIQTDWCTLSQAIPAGGTFVIRSTSTLTNGQFYAARNGLTAVLSRTTGAARISPVMAAAGDSMTALYGGTWLRGMEKVCPIIQASIFGTTANTYSTGSNFTRQLEVFQMAGCTDFIANWSINDITGGASAATLQTRVSTIRDAAIARGMRVHWTTITGGMGAITTSTGSVGTMTANDKMRITTANPTWFVPGSVLTLTESVASTPVTFAETFAIVDVVDVPGGTVTFTVPDRSAAGRTSGTIGTGVISVSQGGTSNNNWLSGGRATSSVAATNAARVGFNGWLRGAGHGMSSVLDLANVMEAIADSGICIAEAQNPGLFNSRVVTVTAGVSTTQFVVNGGPYGDDTFVRLMWLTGPNAGTVSNRGTAGDSSQGNSGNTFTVASALATAPAAGHTAYAQFYGHKALTELDGLHYVPPIDGFAGGFGIAVREVNTWIRARATGPDALPLQLSAGQTLVARDEFSRMVGAGAVYNTNLYNQPSTSGHLWYRAPGINYTVNRPFLSRGRVFPPAGGFGAYLNALPTGLDAYAEARFTCLTSVAGEFAEVFLHLNSLTSLTNRYRVVYDRANSRWGLAGPGITTVFFTDNFPAGAIRTARIQRVGTTISMLVDINDGNGMVSRQSATDASGTITAPGRSGIRLPQNGSSTAGIHCDNFRLVAL